jgi:hypothetical protein
MDFATALARQELLEQDLTSAGNALRAFPHHPNGLTPDAVRATPEWRAAKSRADRAFKALRDYNGVFLKRFARELRALRDERDERRRDELRRVIALGNKP